MLLKVCYSLATFGSTPNVDTKVTMNENKKENQLIMVYSAFTFKRKIKIK